MPVTHFRTADEADFIFRAADLAWDALKVTGFRGAEGISELFEFEIELTSSDPNLAVDQLLGKPCTLEIAGLAGSRYANGIIRRFERTGEGSRLSYYALTMVPAQWLLTKRYNSRIFQKHNCEDMTIPGIIKKVCKDAGIPDDHFRWALEDPSIYKEREYVVQYRETEMNFIARLMEEEGMFFFFEFVPEGHKMVIGDSQVAFANTPNQSVFPFRSPNGMVPEQEQVFHVRDTQEVQIGAVCLEEFDFKNPATEMRSTASGEAFTSLEFSEFPGEFVEPSEGSRYARLRLEEFQCSKHILEMRATIRGLLPGFKMELQEHPTAAFNAEYLVTQVTHTALQLQSLEAEQGAQGPGFEYIPQIRVIPADVVFRPARRSPRPVVTGTQTAIVVGPQEEEIYTDQYGRVKVQFHWDREGTYNENSSCWIRCSQAAAGGKYGFMFLPRVGQEVIVDFLEGNPDRPIIVGRVYNGDHMPPYTLPDERTKIVLKGNSSKGGGGCNEIRFEDLKDKEQILIQAQKQMDTRVKAGHFHTNAAYHLIVGGEDQYGNLYGGYLQLVHKEKRTHVKDYREMWIEGDEQYFVDGNQLVEIGGDKLEVVQGKVKVESSSRSVQTPTYSLSADTIKLKANNGIELVCGGSSVVVVPGGVYINGTKVYINSGAGPAQPEAPDVATPAYSDGDPSAADRSQPGQDHRYDGGGVDVPPVEVEVLEKAPTFVEIKVVDASREQRPVSGETIKVRFPNGQEQTKTTDGNGIVRIENIDPAGNCEFNLPQRDDKTWHFLRFEPAT